MVDQKLLLDCVKLALYADSDQHKQYTVIKRLLRETVHYVDELIATSKKEILSQDVHCLLKCLRYASDPEFDTSTDAFAAELILNLKSEKMEGELKHIVDELAKVAETRLAVSPRRVASLVNGVRHRISLIKGTAHIRSLYASSHELLNMDDDPVEMGKKLESLLGLAHSLPESFSSCLELPETLDKVDFGDMKSIRTAMSKVEKKIAEGGFKFGWQAFSELLLESQWTEGELLCIASKTYGGKSLFLRMLCKWASLYHVRNKNHEKPEALVYISFENEVDKTSNRLFLDAWYSSNKEPPPKKMSAMEKSKFIHDHYNKRGLRFILFRYSRGTFTFGDYVDLMNKLSKEYDICYSIIDYFALMSLDGIDGPNHASQLQTLLGNIYNFGSTRGIRTGTGAQLDQEGERVIVESNGMPVENLGTRHLSDCKSLAKETDIFLFSAVATNHLGDSYFCVSIVKNRNGSIPTDKKRMFGVKFGPNGLEDDIGKSPQHVNNIFNIKTEDDTVSETSAF